MCIDDYFHIYCNDCNKLLIEYVKESGFFGDRRGKQTVYDINTTYYWNRPRCKECSEKLKRFIDTYYYKNLPDWDN